MIIIGVYYSRRQIGVTLLKYRDKQSIKVHLLQKRCIFRAVTKPLLILYNQASRLYFLAYFMVTNSLEIPKGEDYLKVIHTHHIKL